MRAIDILREHLQSKGFPFENHPENHDILQFTYQGTNFIGRGNENNDVSLLIGAFFTIDDSQKGDVESLLKLANKLNDETKEIRVYIDDDNDVSFESALMLIEGDKEFEMLFDRSTGVILRSAAEFFHEIEK